MNFDVTFSEGKTVNLSMTGDAKYSVTLGSASTFVPDHSKLRNRDAENQHPIKAITGLEQTLNNLVYKEFKTGSTTKYKELSDNNFTDEEKAKLAALSGSGSGTEGESDADKGDGFNLTSWADVQKIVRLGLADKYFSIGDQLVCSKDGEQLVWDVIGIDHDTPANKLYTHSLTIQLHDLFSGGDMAFDAAEADNPIANRAQYGDQTWATSNIRQWLNADGDKGAWFTKQKDYDVAPNYATSKAGFLHGMDADFLATVGEVSKVTALSVFDGGGTVSSTEKFFLLSQAEVFGGNKTNEGTFALDGTPYAYYSGGSDLTTAAVTADSNRIKYSNGTAHRWWLRGAHTYTAFYVDCVFEKGNISGWYASTGSSYVAPACCII